MDDIVLITDIKFYITFFNDVGFFLYWNYVKPMPFHLKYGDIYSLNLYYLLTSLKFSMIQSATIGFMDYNLFNINFLKKFNNLPFYSISTYKESKNTLDDVSYQSMSM